MAAGAWRDERDRALLALENEERASARTAAALALFELMEASEDRAEELREVVPRLVADAQEQVRRVGVALAGRVLEKDSLQDFLTARLADASALVRVEAAGQLADMAVPSVRAALAPMLEDPALPVRFEAARGIAALHHSAGLEILIEVLKEPDFRFRALGAIAELGDERALPAVRVLFGKWLLPPFDRTQAAGVLARFGDPAGVAHLEKRAGKRWSPDRAMAVELLGEVRAPRALERLSALANDPRDPSRGAAARGLGRLGDPSVTELLSGLLESSAHPADLRLDAAEGLCLLGTPEARAKVRAVLSTLSDAELRTELEEILESSHPPAKGTT